MGFDLEDQVFLEPVLACGVLPAGLFPIKAFTYLTVWRFFSLCEHAPCGYSLDRKTSTKEFGCSPA